MLRVALVAKCLLRPVVLGAGVLGVGMVGFAACTRELDEHPPLATPCEGDECNSPIGIPPLGGGAMAPGGGGAAGSGGGEDLEPGTLVGSVRRVTSADLFEDEALTTSVDVSATGFRLSLVRVPTETVGSFRLEAVDRVSALRVVVSPSDATGPGADVVETLQTVDALTLATTSVELSILSRTLLDDLIDVAFVMAPTAFDENRGSVIVTVLDRQGDPLPGVVLAPDDAQTSLAYDDGGLYSDTLEQTGARGSFVVLNVPVTSSGTLLRLIYNGDAYESRASLEVGAVTLHTVRISPP